MWKDDYLLWQGRADNIVKVHGRKISLDRMEGNLSRVLGTEVVCKLLESREGVSAFVLEQGNLTIER